ncbi:MAG: acetyl-CoA carboxylase carboxyltransferase subunit alpha [Candidatus Eisenbacteria bacterium]|uniref:Acetyl-coenzyme A carboxylase carboxyl transferase subunit alpha n=1 Tax=Eiseniibacteriota bacterium TaxID=2212470 RepID=A0A956NBL4_UNCEI|nr:acetyl-CoA carboxylase carboxyltransferase subunit alpha [Candidatus Eisenbacteria bacterium]MCB9462445.1 acetyl-CoA carboxylase carboxyltransferase subunit alpha [Candidatus Eisenbacteria bacterium]
METAWLDFERPLVELERKIEDLRAFATQENLEFTDELKKLEAKAERLRSEIYSELTAWQRVQLARHPRRPYLLDYIPLLFTEFLELHGDRTFAEDAAIVGGMARFEGRPVIIMGHQKGRNTKENIHRNFGMPHPEGYRKALRLMRLGEKFGAPIITFVDTPGAYPGIGAEERGQSEAIAKNLLVMSRLKVPILVFVVGEGGSGGALAIAIGDRVLMLENSVYSVISPEGCAAILWKDRAKAPESAQALRVSAQEIYSLGVIDRVVPEPLGGAHRDPKGMAETLRVEIREHLALLSRIPTDELLEERLQKYLKMGRFLEPNA